MKIRIEKTVMLSMALAKLHRYCINAKDNHISANAARNKLTSEINGAVPLVQVEGHDEGSADMVPEQLLHGGEHFDDIGYVGCCCPQCHYKSMTNAPLPRD